MATIRRRPQFIRDVSDACCYIAWDSVARADAFVTDLEKRYQMLADMPQSGVRRFPNYPEFRLFPFGNHLIVYRPLPDASGIELVFTPREIILAFFDRQKIPVPMIYVDADACPVKAEILKVAER